MGSPKVSASQKVKVYASAKRTAEWQVINRNVQVVKVGGQGGTGAKGARYKGNGNRLNGQGQGRQKSAHPLPDLARMCR